jgi:DNA-binding LacI/PurR family transcriptional regulator/DNA-binding transcriptional regulator YhcF (GntR family)
MSDIFAVNHVKKNRRPAVFETLQRELSALIDSGELAPGALIPPENELAVRYGISRSSVRIAMRNLEIEGKLFKRHGKGTFVKDAAHNDKLILVPEAYNIGLEIGEPPVGEDWYYSKLVQGVDDACFAGHCRLVLLGKLQSGSIRKKMCDGVISTCAGDNYDLLEYWAGIEVYPALINRIAEHEQIAYFSVNYRQESKLATRVLLKTGHRRIGIVMSDLGNAVTKTRYLGFVDAITEHNVTVEDNVCNLLPAQPGDVYTESIYNFLVKTKVSAVFLTNGCFALPLFAAIQRLNLKVPDDFEIICFDDIEYMYPIYKYPFYYVKMPLLEMGRDATEYLIGKIQNGKHAKVIKKIYNAEQCSVGY